MPGKVGAVEITFLPPTCSSVRYGRSARDKELEIAEARAHAARVSHHKRRQIRISKENGQARTEAGPAAAQEEQETEEKQVEVPPAHNGHIRQHDRDTFPCGHAQELVIPPPLARNGFHGSSDPFDAFPVRVTPEINRLIVYARDVVLPHLMVPRYMRRLTLGAPKTVVYKDSDRVMGGSSYLFIMDVFRRCENEGATLAWLTSHVPALVSLAIAGSSSSCSSYQAVKDLSVLALKMRVRSIKLLRRDLLRGRHYHHQDFSDHGHEDHQDYNPVEGEGHCQLHDDNCCSGEIHDRHHGCGHEYDHTRDGLQKHDHQGLNLPNRDRRQKTPRSMEAIASLRLHVRGLFESECMAGDAVPAKAHAAMLMRFDDPFGDDYLARAHDTLTLMFNSAELACKTMQRTNIPFGAYTSARLTDFWTVCSPALPPSKEESDDDVHPSVRHPVIRDIMGRLRYCMRIAETPIPMNTAVEKVRGNTIYGWLITRTLHDMGLLINLYFDLVEGKVPGQQLIEACVTLALLHMMRKSIHEAEVDGTDTREASHAILPRLRRGLEQAMSTLTKWERSHYDDALLWMLYLGALYEQGQIKKRVLSLRRATRGAVSGQKPKSCATGPVAGGGEPTGRPCTAPDVNGRRFCEETEGGFPETKHNTDQPSDVALLEKDRASHVQKLQSTPKSGTNLWSLASSRQPDDKDWQDAARSGRVQKGEQHRPGRTKGTEQDRRPVEAANQPSLWFTQMLVQQADRLHLNCWEDVRRVLDRFVYDRHLRPDGQEWFERIVLGQ